MKKYLTLILVAIMTALSSGYIEDKTDQKEICALVVRGPGVIKI